VCSAECSDVSEEPTASTFRVTEMSVEVFIAAKIYTVTVWTMTPCSLVFEYQHFERRICLQIRYAPPGTEKQYKLNAQRSVTKPHILLLFIMFCTALGCCCDILITATDTTNFYVVFNTAVSTEGNVSFRPQSLKGFKITSIFVRRVPVSRYQIAPGQRVT
jgi:hypothetical protein